MWFSLPSLFLECDWEAAVFAGCRSEDRGLELSRDFSTFSDVADRGGTESGAVQTDFAILAEPDLARIVALWPSLPLGVKAEIARLADNGR